jgi:hypothetical protein
MTAVTFTYVMQVDNAAKVTGNTKRLISKFQALARQELFVTAKEIRSIMGRPAPKPTYPIKWDSVRQRCAFFATDAFTIKGKRPKGYGPNRHIPTKRSHVTRRAWYAIKTEDGADVGNPLAHARYINGTAQGMDQSNIHKGRAVLFQKVGHKIIVTIPARIRRRMRSYAKEQGYSVQ